MPFGFLQSILDFLTPKHVQRKKSMTELMTRTSVIETRNECNEKRYIQIDREIHVERNVDLEILVTKCKRLLSFVEMKGKNENYSTMIKFVDRVRQAKYRRDDIKHLFKEFETIENKIKKSSKSFDNLSRVRMIG
jgi:tRNA C32,U32 (ribose-2'-O)-methylase TrmJ